MSDEHDEHKDGVKVTDKRRFTADGEDRAADDTAGDDAQAYSKASAEGAHAAGPEGGAREDSSVGPKRAAMPPIDFATFVLSLASSAQVHLGILPNPSTGAHEKNPELAQQSIDILAMLKEKTEGNLANEERRLIEGLLYDLRMKYVELSK